MREGWWAGRLNRRLAAGWLSRVSAAGAVSIIAAGIGACGGSSTTSVTKTVTASSPSASSAATTGASTHSPRPTAAPATRSPSGSIPDYRPSAVVSKISGSTVLTTPAPVSTVGGFYRGVLARGGWQIISSSRSAYSASFTARRPGEGVTISVYPRGSGSGVAISTHPE